MPSLRTRRQTSSRLNLEALEDRQLLDAGGITTPLAPLTPFASIADFDKYFLDRAVTLYDRQFGAKAPWFQVVPLNAATSLIYPGPSFGPGTSPSSNPQVPGVDEGDMVLSDGAHLFVLADNQLIVLDKTAGGGLTIASRRSVPVNPVTMFLDGTRLWVISQVRSPYIYYATPYSNSIAFPGDPSWNSYRPLLEVTAYDINAAGTATLVQDKLLDGTLVAARSVDDHLYLVVQNSNAYLPAPLIVQNSDGSQVYESKDAYIARITPLIPDLVLPHVYQTGPSSDNPVSIGLLSQPLDVYQPRLPGDSVEESILTINMTATGDAFTDVQTLFTSYSTAIYATTTHLYLAGQYISSNLDGATSTGIQSFVLGGDHVTPEAAGVVPGYVTGQFAMDEFNGYLRVATNSSPSRTTGVYVLQRDGTDLKVVGSVADLGDNTYLSAVRFAAEKVFLATAHYLAPYTYSLLTVDLSDPTHPELASTLALGRQVSYLQMLDDSHLLAVGFGANVELTLLDVHDLHQASIIDHLEVKASDGQATWSPAGYGPQTLAFSPDGHFLALPIRAGYYPTIGQLANFDYLYQIDFEAGFHLVGTVEHDSEVERSLFDGTQFYSIALSTAKSQEIIKHSTPGNPTTYSLGLSQEVRYVDNPRQVQTPHLEPAVDNTFKGTLLSFVVTDLTGLVASIEWGDGTSSIGSIFSNDNQTYSVAGEHTYSGRGRYTITVFFSRNGQSAGSANNFIDIGHVDPQVEYFLRRVYVGVLQRTIDDAGLENWSNILKQGASRTYVTQSIMHSTEYYNLQVQYLYSQLLKRAADDSGLASWIPYLASGHSLDDVRAGFLSSQEYFARSGSVSGFVSALYVDLFGRPADPGGQLAWQTVLQLGLPREQAVALMAHSQEAAIHEVMQGFQTYLGRSPEQGGLLYFAGAIQSGQNSQDVVAALLASHEFFQKY